MSDDAQEIRAAARAVNTLAMDARRAGRAVGRAKDVRWQSDGADRYRARLRDRAREFDRCADGLDELRDRLFAHARAVERREAAIGAGVSVVVRHGVPGTAWVGTDTLGAGVETVRSWLR